VRRDRPHPENNGQPHNKTSDPRLRQAQAALQVNTALLTFYWGLGADIVERQKTAEWGSGFLKQLSADLMAEFPDMQGFSHNNLQYIKRWYLFYVEGIDKYGTGCSTFSEPATAQAPQSVSVQNHAQAMVSMDDTQNEQWIIARLVQIPWSHNLVIISRCHDVNEALYYVNQTTAQANDRDSAMQDTGSRGGGVCPERYSQTHGRFGISAHPRLARLSQTEPAID